MLCHESMNMTFKNVATNSFSAYVTEVFIRPDPNGMNSLSRNGLSNKVIGDGYMFLAYLTVRHWGRLDNTPIVPIDIGRLVFRHRNA